MFKTKSTDHYPNDVRSLAICIESNTSLAQITGGCALIATKAFDFPFKPEFPPIIRNACVDMLNLFLKMEMKPLSELFFLIQCCDL